MTPSLQDVYEVRPRKHHRGVDLIFDALLFGRVTQNFTAPRIAL
jgi:hypothetical protein